MSSNEADPKVEVPEETKPVTEPQEQNSFGFSTDWFSKNSAWGASLLNSAKEKTKNTLDMVKKDLSELTDAMSAEVADLTHAAKEGLGTAATAVKQQAQMLEKLVTPEEEQKDLPGETTETQHKSDQPKDSMTSSMSFGWMTKVLDTVTDTVKNLGTFEDSTQGEDLITEVIKPKPARKTALTAQKLAEIQTADETYLTTHEGDETFSRWIKRFRIDEYDGEITMLLSNSAELRAIHGKFVPSEFDNETFWSRYFYTVELAEMDEELNNSFHEDALKVDTAGKKTSTSSSKKSSPTSESSSIVVLEQPTSPSQSEWSVCSEKNIEEIPEDVPTGPLTPKAEDEKKEEGGWVNWDE